MADSKNSISQSEINDIVWRACDTFRGTLDPAQYKDYILVMLFLKYLSDLNKDKREQYEKQYTDKSGKVDKARVDRAMKRERFVLPKDSDFDFLHSKRTDANIGQFINVALENIEDANKSKLENVFRNIDFNSEPFLGRTKERNRRLKDLLEDFADEKLDLRPSRMGNHDIIGNAYMYLISRFASDAGKKGGEFYTPAEVSELLAKLVQPKAGDRICDPACGSGSLLIKVAEEVGDDDFALFGQESNGSTWALCQMNMFLHGIDNTRIEWCDTITNPLLLDGNDLMKFNVVVANPPFSLDKWGQDEATADKYERFWRGVPPKSKGDYAFITHMIETALPEDGRVGVIVPHGVLFRGGGEGKIRTQLIEEDMLDAVVGLPANLFYGTGIPAAILIFRKAKKDKSKSNVLFIDASREYVDGKNNVTLGDEHIKKIVATYKKRKDVDKYAHVADADEIAENDFNLNIPRYVDTFEEEDEIDVQKVQQEIEALESELAGVQERMTDYLQELNL